jgi:hypothetical protein
MALAPDGKTVVSGGEDRALRFWEVTTGRELRVSPKEPGAIFSAAFSPDGKRFAVGLFHSIPLRAADTGAELARL